MGELNKTSSKGLCKIGNEKTAEEISEKVGEGSGKRTTAIEIRKMFSAQ
jgi:hypothetical protein